MSFRHRIRVRYRECDMQGHVFFAEYPAFLDVAITELWRERVGGWDAMVERGADLVVADLQCRYVGSAQFDDEIDVVIEIARVGESSLTCDWRVERDSEELVLGSVRYVCVDPVGHAKQPIPDDVRTALAA